MSEDKKIHKVTETDNGCFVPNLAYCDHVERGMAETLGICPEFGGRLNLPAPNNIQAKTHEEAGQILDRDLTKIMDNIAIPELKERKACAECKLFDKCWKMKIYKVLESIQYNINVKQP